MLKKILMMIIPFFAMTLLAQTEDPVKKISQLFKDGQYQDVIIQVQEYVKNYPNSEQVKGLKLFMGMSYIKTGKNNLAVQLFEQHNADYPDFEKNEQVKYLIGKLYYDSGEYDKSQSMLNEQLSAYPGGEYKAKAMELLKSIDQKKKASTHGPVNSTYSITKITWTKVATFSCLVASPLFLLVGNDYGTKADNIYNTSYKNALSPEDAQKYFSQVKQYNSDAETFKNLSWISLVAAVGFFAVDYFSTGRVILTATDKQVSLSYKF
jgi:TolA-binding protein